MIDRFSRVNGAAEIEFDVRHDVQETSWFAIRGYGTRLDEAVFGTPPLFSTFKPATNLHSAPIYVTLENAPALERSARSRQTARAWLARLEDLETVLVESNLDELGAKLERPNFDAVPAETLRRNRADLLAEIQVAKDHFRALVQRRP